MSDWKTYRKTATIKACQMTKDFSVETLEGTMQGRAGDFLAIGVNGEKYPIQKAVFEKSYIEVAESP